MGKLRSRTTIRRVNAHGKRKVSQDTILAGSIMINLLTRHNVRSDRRFLVKTSLSFSRTIEAVAHNRLFGM